MMSFELHLEHNNSVYHMSSGNQANKISYCANGRGSQGRGRGNNNGITSSNPNGKSSVPRSISEQGGKRPICQVCGKVGHDALCCYHHFDHTYQADENRVAVAATSSYAIDPNYYADTGATDHITHDLEHLTTRERYTSGDHVQVANWTGVSIAHIGNSSIAGYNHPFYLNHILHVPKINRHLLQVHKLIADNNAFVEFYPNSFFVKDQVTKKILLKGRCKKGLYMLNNNLPIQALLSAKITQDQWHKRLGHPSSQVVHKILKDNKISIYSHK